MVYESDRTSAMNVTTPQVSLLRYQSCLGCHMGPNTGSNYTPYVTNTTVDYGASRYGIDGDTLAGGSFYWATTDETKGHNPVGIGSPSLLTTPPGFSDAFDANGSLSSGAAAWSGSLTCAGTNGCHGRHDDGATPITDPFAAIAGSHHGSDATIDGLTVASSYRFLFKIKGIEDDDWEFTNSPSDHNAYYAEPRTNDTAPSSATISYLCAECHGNFHSGAGTEGATVDDSARSPWIRHPTDFDMNSLAATSEYYGYGGATNAYDVVAPVGTNDASGAQSDYTVKSRVLQGAGDAIVTCLSCHRAHGAPYYKSMRWDYTNSVGGDCARCHTSKN